MPTLHIRCRRCRRKMLAANAVHGYGPDCATFLGLTGATTDTGHDGPDLLDLLTPGGDDTSQNDNPAGTKGDVTDEPRWIKSSFCGSNACVEVAATGDRVLMRDSKNPDREPLDLARPVWWEFIDGVTAGDFQDL
jgi:hypothetical protein